MSKVLIIAEKPSVARDIAGAIIKANSASKDGYIESSQYLISWAIGHLVTLCEPDEYNPKYKKWNMLDLPISPELFSLKPVAQTKKQFQIIKSLMHRHDVGELICATDAGREGELIFRYIYQLAECNKPFKRLWISSMTEEAIYKGFQELKDGSEYDTLYHSARCRSEADWLIGINGTRAFTVKNNTIFSIGRVQTPTLAMIVNRQWQIQDFKPTDYFEVKAIYKDFDGIWINIEENSTKIATIDKAERIANQVKGTIGTVTDIKKEKKSQPPPLLYDLTELQRDANQVFGYTAKETLDIAQALYEKHKLITYPRTDSRYLSNDMKDTVIITMNKINIEPYSKLISSVINNLKFTTRIINDKKITDHHACIPTPRTPNLQRLNPKERNIYDLIVKRMIAVFYPNYQFETKVILIQNQGHVFQSKGKSVIEWGWKMIYTNDNAKRKNDIDEEQQLPTLKKNQQIEFLVSEILKKQTQPPKPYNESTLLSAMENAGRMVEDEELKEQLRDSGLGTPATRASIIERLIQVGYIERQKKALIPTAKGMAIIQVIPNELQSPEFTGKWERALNKMAKGNFSTIRFMESINNFTNYIVTEARKSKPINR
jgi:DNA topoisomerase-3